jgi:hypothetical protein
MVESRTCEFLSSKDEGTLENYIVRVYIYKCVELLRCGLSLLTQEQYI